MGKLFAADAIHDWLRDFELNVVSFLLISRFVIVLPVMQCNQCEIVQWFKQIIGC